MNESDDEAVPAERSPEAHQRSEDEVPEQVTRPDSDPAEADSPEAPEVEPGPGGYAGRDPKTEMPRIPSVPETQEDPKSHDAAPPEKGKEPSASD